MALLDQEKSQNNFPIGKSSTLVNPRAVFESAETRDGVGHNRDNIPEFGDPHGWQSRTADENPAAPSLTKGLCSTT